MVRRHREDHCMTTSRKLLRRVLPALGVSGALLAGMTTGAEASSHREAPLTSEDPTIDLTDVYAFVSPDDSSKVTLIANVIPFEHPAGGPNFYKFGDDVLYQLNVDSNGDAVADLQYQFRFTTTYANPKTFLYNTGQVTSMNDSDLNVRQKYTVTEVNNVTHKTKVLGSGLPVPPVNVGPRSTPNYEANLGSAGVKSLGDGMKVFAGPRDDPFFVDLGSIFDLGGLRPFNAAHLIPLPTAAGKDYVAGFDVHTIALQIPKSRLTRGGDPVIGVWATTYRRAQRVLSSNGTLTNQGSWVQVARLGMPLVNEVVIPIGQKDKFNASQPVNDGQFAASVLKPELAGLIPVLYPGVNVPTNVDLGLGLGGREDIATIFLTGIPGVNQPKKVTPSEMLRLNTSMATSAFPNGRALTDDVTDTEIRALAGATAFTPAFNISPNKDLGDGVNANDKAFTGSFPYLASPTSGYDS
jgi:Domain of unknown function (DUF4331)